LANKKLLLFGRVDIIRPYQNKKNEQMKKIGLIFTLALVLTGFSVRSQNPTYNQLVSIFPELTTQIIQMRNVLQKILKT